LYFLNLILWSRDMWQHVILLPRSKIRVNRTIRHLRYS